MRKLYRSLKVSLIILIVLLGVSCQTAPALDPIRIPAFTVQGPPRPILEDIPQDPSGAIRALTRNLSALAFHVEKMEWYSQIQDEYYRTVLGIFSGQ